MNMKLADAKREEGFTLIELLVVVIIIGILAAIAIPIFLDQRTKARISAVESTLRAGATYMEIYYTEGNDYTTDVQELHAEGYRWGDEVTDPVITVDGNHYCITAAHVQDADVNGVFDSEVGTPDVDDGGPEDACTIGGP